ncbi:Glycosyltransferase family 31 protein [Teratosphaeria destructans]|uniref:Glycosyltransferase family 31 protein n=1 Tax=Teratosphaeria destructans TaxID=418781 RepID=A0A9W7SRB1_9PEZI|nr:Glycosyltransferase family 31 protein [Teratosphaeria destructans]
MSRTKISSNVVLAVAVMVLVFLWFGPGLRLLSSPTSMSARGSNARVRHPMANDRSMKALAVPPVRMAEIQEVLEEVNEPSELFANTDQDDVGQYTESLALESLPCLGLEGADDVVLIIKTGSTEALEKLPVHFQTTLNCYKHHLIFSDFGEFLEGHRIHDALDQVTEEVRLADQAFELWRRLKDGGREVLDQSELSTNDKGDPDSPYGNTNIGGWRLDKMKNVPMIGKTLEQVPDAKWYVWMMLIRISSNPTCCNGCGSSTMRIWYTWGTQPSSTTKYLPTGVPATFSRQRLCMRLQLSTSKIKNIGIVMRQVTGRVTAFWGLCSRQWVQNSSGPFQLSRKATRQREIGRRLAMTRWCYPAVSYHHVKPETITSLFHFERSWIAAAENADKASPMRHSDVFKMLIQPQLPHEKSDWDNASDLSQEARRSILRSIVERCARTFAIVYSILTKRAFVRLLLRRSLGRGVRTGVLFLDGCWAEFTGLRRSWTGVMGRGSGSWVEELEMDVLSRW